MHPVRTAPIDPDSALDRDRLRDALQAIAPLIDASVESANQRLDELQQEAAEAELAPYSWELSGPKGAEMRYSEYAALVDALEDLQRSLRDTLEQLDQG